LRQAYKKLGINHKRVRINRNARRPTQKKLIAKDRRLLEIMKAHLQTSGAADRLVQVDECIFSVKTFKPMSWAGRY